MGIFDYLVTLWRVIGMALWLDPALLQAAGAAAGTEAGPRAFALAIGVIVVAGVSSLLGQSVTLFINRVRPGRFAFRRSRLLDPGPPRTAAAANPLIVRFLSSGKRMRER